MAGANRTGSSVELARCARCRRAAPVPGKTRCEECAAKDRADMEGVYQKKGGWGGKRQSGQQRCGWCGMLGHNQKRHA